MFYGGKFTHLSIRQIKGEMNFRKFFYLKSVFARHSTLTRFSTLTKRARALARKEMSSACTAVYFLREIVAMRPRKRRKEKEEEEEEDDAQERTKWRTQGRSLFGTSRRRRRRSKMALSVVSRFLFLSVSFSRLNS